VGCKVNFCDTETILQTFKDAGYEIVQFAQKADVYVINTCTVTNTGDGKSRRLISRARRNNHEAIVAAVGCYTQLNSAEIADLGADIIMGTRNREKLVDYVLNYRHGSQTLDLTDFDGDEHFDSIFVGGNSGRTRTFLKIQDGCDNFCAYCIVPYARGRSRSRPVNDILQQARTFAENGYREIVICGIHIASFGNDLQGWDLLGIIQAISEIDGIERIRLSSLEPRVITKDFVAGIRNSKVCPHFHLPLQSGSDAVLAWMGRRYTTADYSRAVEILREAIPDVGITSDIITGFPGESDENFVQSAEFIREMQLSGLHVFPYSAKKGTAAAEFLEQVPHQIKAARAKELLAIDKELSQNFAKQFLGRKMPILVEGQGRDGKMMGKTGNYIGVSYDGEKADIGRILEVELVRLEENGIHAQI